MFIWQLVLMQIVTFTLIILFLRWLLHANISRGLKKLKQLNQDNLEKEKTLKEELERAKQEATREIEQGKIDGENIKEQAKEKGEKEREEIINRARKEAKRLINEAERDCQRRRTELTLQMQENSVGLALEAVKYIFTEQGKESLHSQLIDELLMEVGGLDKQQVKAEGDTAEVHSAHKLAQAQKEKLQKVLSEKLNKNISLSEKIDKEIIGGLLIRLGGFVIDGSIKNKIRKVIAILREKSRA